MRLSAPARCSPRGRLNEPLVTERIAGKFLEATRAPIVIEFSVRLKERRPGFLVIVLQCFDGGLDDWIRERIGLHCHTPFRIWSGVVNALTICAPSCGGSTCTIQAARVSRDSMVFAIQAAKAALLMIVLLPRLSSSYTFG